MEKYAIAFIHLPSGEVGRSEFIFTTREGADDVCKELNQIGKTIVHFSLGEKENLRIVAKRTRDKHNAK